MKRSEINNKIKKSTEKVVNCPNPKCNKSFSSAKLLISRHMIIRHQCKSYLHWCKCGAPWHSRRSLMTHLNHNKEDHDKHAPASSSDTTSLYNTFVSSELPIFGNAQSMVNVKVPERTNFPEHAIGRSVANFNPQNSSSASSIYPRMDEGEVRPYLDSVSKNHEKDFSTKNLVQMPPEHEITSCSQEKETFYQNYTNTKNNKEYLNSISSPLCNTENDTYMLKNPLDSNIHNEKNPYMNTERDSNDIHSNYSPTILETTIDEDQNSTFQEDDEISNDNSRESTRKEMLLVEMHDKVCRHRFPQIYEKEFVGAIDLWQILHKANVPIYLYDEIMNWAVQNSDNVPKRGEPYTYKGLLNTAALRLYPKDIMSTLKPKLTNLELPTKRRAAVSSFDIKSQIYKLLSDPDLMQWHNLIFSGNRDDPFSTIIDENPDCDYGDIETAEWYIETFLSKISDRLKEILVPVIMFIDATSKDSFGKISLEGIVLTLGIFKREVRNRPDAWVTLGYIENLDNMYGSKSTKTGDKLEDYHFMIQHILREYEQIEKDGFYWKFFTDDGKSHTRLLKFSIIFIIGDTKGNDALCGRYGSHTNTKGLCRDCDVPTELADKCNYRCKFFKHSEILKMNNNRLKEISFRIIENNIFSRLCFGANLNGINGALPPEPLHCIKLGPPFDRLPVALKSRVGGKIWSILDNVVASICTHGCRQSHRDFPSILNFTKGIGSGSKLTADEKYSRCFAIYLALCTETMKEQTVGRRVPRKKKKK